MTPEDRPPFQAEPLDGYPPQVGKAAKLVGAIGAYLDMMREVRLRAQAFGMPHTVDAILDYPQDKRVDELGRLMVALTQDAASLMAKARRGDA